MKKKEEVYKKLNEYRVIYNAGEEHSAMDSSHYYQAYSFEEALDFHDAMMKKRGYRSQIVNVQMYCPYSHKWIDQKKEPPNKEGS